MQEENAQNVEKILARFRESFNLSNNSRLAELIGVKPNVVSAWIARNSIGDYDTLFTFCRKKGVNIDWLLTGEGEMFRNKEEKQEEKGEEKQAQEPPTPSPAEPNKIKQLEQKVNYLYKVISERSSEFQPLPSSSQSIQIPFYTYPVSAGIPDLPPDDSHDLLTLDKKLLKHPKNAFAVRVSGTSMVGAGIYDGDILVIERAAEPIPDKIFIFNIPSEGYTVKTLQKRKNGEFWLKPSNPKFKPTKLTPALQASLVGRVVLIIKSP